MSLQQVKDIELHIYSLRIKRNANEKTRKYTKTYQSINQLCLNPNLVEVNYKNPLLHFALSGPFHSQCSAYLSLQH